MARAGVLFGVSLWIATATAGFAPAQAGEAEAEAGERVFRSQCGSCHSIKPGENRNGPSLFGVVGRKAGSTDFPRYRGLVGAQFTWDAASLDGYLADPRAFVRANTANTSTGMTYMLQGASKRAEVIAYLETLR